MVILHINTTMLPTDELWLWKGYEWLSHCPCNDRQSLLLSFSFPFFLPSHQICEKESHI